MNQPPVIFLPTAQAEFKEAATWYDEQRQGLGDEFVAEVERSLDRVSEDPRRYAIIYRNTHRISLRRFPYNLFYRIYPNHIVVLAVMHGSRNPKSWKVRSDLD